MLGRLTYSTQLSQNGDTSESCEAALILDIIQAIVRLGAPVIDVSPDHHVVNNRIYQTYESKERKVLIVGMLAQFLAQ